MAYSALLEAKEQGKIKHIGITSHNLNTIEKAIEDGKFDTIQFPYNIVEGQADEVFKKLMKRNWDNSNETFSWRCFRQCNTGY